MIWFILGFIIWCIFIIEIIRFSWHSKVGEILLSLFGCFMFALLGNILSAGILYATSSLPYNDDGISKTRSSYHEILPLDDENYVRVSQGKHYPQLTVLLDDGRIETYSCNGVETQLRVVKDGETPNIRTVRHGGYTDWRKWLSVFSCYGTWRYITLPTGISYPIT